MAGFDLTSVISAVLPSTLSTVEVRSAFSPPYIIHTSDLIPKPGAPPTPPPSGLVQTAKQTLAQLVKPTIILSGGVVGDQTIAPYGVAGPDEWKKPLIVAAGVTAFVLWVTYTIGHRRGRASRY